MHKAKVRATKDKNLFPFIQHHLTSRICAQGDYYFLHASIAGVFVLNSTIKLFVDILRFFTSSVP